MELAQIISLAYTWGMHGVGAGWMALMMVFWGAIIFGAIWLLRGAARGESSTQPEPLDKDVRSRSSSAGSPRAQLPRRTTGLVGTCWSMGLSSPLGGPKTTH